MSLKNRWLIAVFAVSASSLVFAGAAPAVEESASGGATAETERVLTRGSKGPLVKRLQRALHIKADGVYGKATARAVRRFQKSHGLKVDGVAGPATLDALGVGAKSAAAPRKLPRKLVRIAKCESGGNPRAVSPDGRYRGKYQFSRPTWRRLGGKGDPAKAPEAEQDRLALKLYKQAGTSPWPSCG